MTLDAARMFVGPPVYTPARWGLWDSIDHVEDGGLTPVTLDELEADTDHGHWQLGVKFEVDSFAFAGVTTDPCTGAPATKTPTQVGIVTRGATPFTVFAEIQCSPVGHWEDYAARTVQALKNGEARAIEREFWTGAGGTMPHLAASVAVTSNNELVQTAATDLNLGGSDDVLEGLSALEANLVSCYGGLGIIHVPWLAIPQLFSELAVIKDGKVLRTQLGTLVVAGAGYPGTSPLGVAPAAGHVFAYATGAMSGWRSKITVTGPRPSLRRDVNTMVMVAERTYVLAVDSSCHFAVNLQAGGEASGTVASPV